MRHSARAPIIAAVLAGILLGASAGVLALTAPASAGPAETPTPSPTAGPTPSPTASPTATPYPQSTITIRFVRDGEQITIALTQPFRSIKADGSVCNVPITPAIVAVDHFSIAWPSRVHGVAEACVKGPPTTVEIDFRPYDVATDTIFDPIAASVVWTGADITADLDVPAAVPELGSAPTSSPLPERETGTPTPAQLPTSGTGGSSATHRWMVPVGVVVLLLATCAMACVISDRKARP